MNFPHDPNPLVSAPLLGAAGGAQSAPIRGSKERPDFRTVAPLREIVPESVPPLDTQGQLQRDQERREAAAQADRERIAAMPTQAQLQARRIEALEADVSDLRVRLARLEAPSRIRGRATVRHRPNDDSPPPKAAA
jgi:hypothetical protein